MAQSRPIYFGYGSNMWLDQMNRRCAENKYLGIALIEGWEWFICEKGYANIRQSPDNQVYGAVYELSEPDEKALDGYEEVPINYVKEYHTVTFLGTKSSPEKTEIKALIYIDVRSLRDGPPRTEYIYRMNMAIASGIEIGIPEEYMDKYLRPFIPKEYDVPDGK